MVSSAVYSPSTRTKQFSVNNPSPGSCAPRSPVPNQPYSVASQLKNGHTASSISKTTVPSPSSKHSRPSGSLDSIPKSRKSCPCRPSRFLVDVSYDRERERGVESVRSSDTASSVRSNLSHLQVICPIMTANGWRGEIFIP